MKSEHLSVLGFQKATYTDYGCIPLQKGKLAYRKIIRGLKRNGKMGINSYSGTRRAAMTLARQDTLMGAILA